jgi:hypothetical protein
MLNKREKVLLAIVVIIAITALLLAGWRAANL